MWEAWGIPQELVLQLAACLQTAETVLAKVNSGECTGADVARCRTVFKELEAKARFMKKHYFLMPPLTPPDFVRLLLAVPKGSRSPVGLPEGQPLLVATYTGGPHVLAVRFTQLPGVEPPDRRSDYGYALYSGLMPPGGATLEQAAGPQHYLMKEPLSGEELLYCLFSRRKKVLVSFEGCQAGMTVFFCARYENQSGAVGTWGPVVRIIVP
jgi:hypothetical protein